MIERNQYLSKLISAKNNGFPKIITGIRRCGKSYLLKEIFKKGSIESLDQETLFTIQKFFENNLNVSET